MITYPLSSDVQQVNLGALNKLFETICVFDSNLKTNNSKHLYSSKMIAIGATDELVISKDEQGLKQLQQFIDKKKQWVFGQLSYDLKNEIENLKSENEDRLNFPNLHFFVPQVVIQITPSEILLHFDDETVSPEKAKNFYHLCFLMDKEFTAKHSLSVKSKISKEKYIERVHQLKEHIAKGDIYEINFCQEFFSENALIDPVEVYEKLNAISKAPFSAFCKFYQRYVLCASPERFIRKTGSQLISQPIKGTVRRSTNPQEDHLLKIQLQNNSKERSENIMIVDLVRNDLSRIAKPGTVEVDELIGVYSFKQVHQLISTIRCQLKNNICFTDIIKSTFPMGSMTGAPKVSAMKLIEEKENTRRGLYSGAIGYITPEGDVDFNVVIRSILYNAENRYLSFMVGSAITHLSNAEEEFDECLLKAKAMLEVLEE